VKTPLKVRVTSHLSKLYWTTHSIKALRMKSSVTSWAT
jgi:hypothetical protein